MLVASVVPTVLPGNSVPKQGGEKRLEALLFSSYSCRILKSTTISARKWKKKPHNRFLLNGPLSPVT